MNELERLIAQLSRPTPGVDLDERINRLLTPQREPRQRSWAWLALAASVGGLGFFLGRQSVLVAPVAGAVSAAAPANDRQPEAAPIAAKVTNIPLDESQLAGFLVRPAVREGMFGKGPVTIEISTTH